MLVSHQVFFEELSKFIWNWNRNPNQKGIVRGMIFQFTIPQFMNRKK